MAADTKPARRAQLAQDREREQHRRRVRNLAVLAVILVAVVAGLYAVFNKSEDAPASGYEVGSPGIGKSAPGFTLTSSTGKVTSLDAFKGKTVLLYFQEGLTCQPCWDQIRDLEKSSAKVKAAGIDQIVSVTTDPANLIARKVKDDALSTPVLSDPDLKVSKEYGANQYGMMGDSRDGHSFVLVGPDGKIQWRADYGGAPKYTMYVKVDKLLADLKSGRQS
ncbi:peroxiredoxin family protein (plasmid) [Streptomyces sp. NBC_00637]|uniref:peroxiredoxin family protein n=1 Tax=Streptomyces sp. NBC_00637 TaxID=2903667 RepID=UPI002F911202